MNTDLIHKTIAIKIILKNSGVVENDNNICIVGPCNVQSPLRHLQELVSRKAVTHREVVVLRLRGEVQAAVFTDPEQAQPGDRGGVTPARVLERARARAARAPSQRRADLRANQGQELVDPAGKRQRVEVDLLPCQRLRLGCAFSVKERVTPRRRRPCIPLPAGLKGRASGILEIFPILLPCSYPPRW